MYKTKLIGREGEAEAARYLERKGYKIIGLNYSCRYGEIDVIAEKDGYAAIVEVKLRELSLIHICAAGFAFNRIAPTYIRSPGIG